MAPPVDVQSKDFLERLVKDSGKLIVHCFHVRRADDGDFKQGLQDDSSSRHLLDMFDEVARSLDSVVSCRVNLSINPDVAADLLTPGRGEGDGGGAPLACWLFFKGGKMVRAHYS